MELYLWLQRNFKIIYLRVKGLVDFINRLESVFSWPRGTFAHLRIFRISEEINNIVTFPLSLRIENFVGGIQNTKRFPKRSVNVFSPFSFRLTAEFATPMVPAKRFDFRF